MRAVRDGNSDQPVAVIQFNCDLPGFQHLSKFRQGRLLHHAVFGRHKDEMIVFKRIHRECDRNFFAFLQRQEVDDGLALRVAGAFGNHIDVQSIDAAQVAEAEHLAVSVGDEDLFNDVAFLHLRRAPARPAASLFLVFRERKALDVAFARQGHHDVFVRDEIQGIEVGIGGIVDFAAAFVPIGGREFREFLIHDGKNAFGLGENIKKIGHRRVHVAVILIELILLKTRQFLQRHAQDRVRLYFRKVIKPFFIQPAPRRDVRRHIKRRIIHVREKRLHQGRLPTARHQLLLGDRRGRGVLDDGDEFVDVGKCHGLTFEEVSLVAVFLQTENRAAIHNFAAVTQEIFDDLPEIQKPRLAVHQSHHVHAERGLHHGELVELIQNHFTEGTDFEFHDDAHLVGGFVADFGNAFDLLVVHETRNRLHEHFLIDLVGNIVYHQNLASRLRFFVVRVRTDDDAAAARAVAFVNALQTKDDAPRGEVGRGHFGNQFFNRRFRMVQEMPAGFDGFRQIVRRDIRRHTDGNTCRAVHQKVRQLRREHHGFALRVVEVGNEVHRFFVQIVEHRIGNFGQSAFRVTHGRRPVAVDGTEVPLTGHEGVAHGEVLRQAHQRLIRRRVPVRMVFTQHVAHDARAFFRGIIERVVHLVHRVQHAAVHRLEAVPNIGKRSPHDDAHRVIEVGLLHFLFKRHRQRFQGVGNRHAVGFAGIDVAQGFRRVRRRIFSCLHIVFVVLIHRKFLVIRGAPYARAFLLTANGLFYRDFVARNCTEK